MPGENVIRVSAAGVATPEFWGWPYPESTPLSYAKWKQELMDAFKAYRRYPISDVPGYDGIATFFNVHMVAMRVFDLRTAGE